MCFAQFLGKESILIALALTGHSLMCHPTDSVLLTRRMVALHQMTPGAPWCQARGRTLITQASLTHKLHFLMKVGFEGEKLGGPVSIQELSLLK